MRFSSSFKRSSIAADNPAAALNGQVLLIGTANGPAVFSSADAIAKKAGIPIPRHSGAPGAATPRAPAGPARRHLFGQVRWASLHEGAL